MNGTASAPPRTYAEWSVLLDRFAQGDDSVLEAMGQGSIQWDAGVAEPWSARLSEALDGRLQALSRQLNLWLKRMSSGADLAQTMLQTRRALGPLVTFCAMPSLPDPVRTFLQQTLERWVTTSQSSLESSLAADRTSQGMLLQALRATPLRLPEIPPSTPGAPEPSSPATRPIRRVLI